MPNVLHQNKTSLNLRIWDHEKDEITKTAAKMGIPMTDLIVFCFKNTMAKGIEDQQLKDFLLQRHFNIPSNISLVKPAKTPSKPSFGKAEPIRYPTSHGSELRMNDKADPNAMFDDDDAPGQEERA